MAEENEQEQTGGRVFVGFHQLGGIRLSADDVRLSAQEAFVLAGQLTAHATMAIQMSYAEQAAAQQALSESGIVIPGAR